MMQEPQIDNNECRVWEKDDEQVSFTLCFINNCGFMSILASSIPRLILSDNRAIEILDSLMMPEPIRILFGTHPISGWSRETQEKFLAVLQEYHVKDIDTAHIYVCPILSR